MEDFSDKDSQNDEYEMQQRDILALIEEYKQKRKVVVYKRLKEAFLNYELLLNKRYAAPPKLKWFAQKKKLVESLRDQKAIQNQDEKAKNFFTVQDAKLLREDVNGKLNRVGAQVQEAISIQTYIKLQLNKQIQALDRVYDINKDTSNRIKRATDGLRTMLRRIMTSKMTRFLSILTVLAIIGLIVIYILKGNGIIKNGNSLSRHQVV